ncbi:MAG TPA: hypothetical protein VFC02_13695 [Anaerolineales bacterium]|jgi:hypothetical protein|nr:hypothetical protein [Anaerolineales bacterium]
MTQTANIQPAVATKSAKTSVEKIRPDLNLEKWSIWQPSKSKIKPRARTFQREIVLADGKKVSAEVEVGFTQKGMLTTEDQKTFYALIKIWEDKGKPTEQTFYSLRGLARILHKGWGTNVIESTDQSLLRLRMTPLIWRNSYHDSSRKDVIEQLDPFNILSDLKIVRRKNDGHNAHEYGYFKFNDFILNNLLNNYTKPLLLEVVLGFKSELAQILYTHLDLIMARRDHYERRTKELFEDLGLEGESYKHPSKRRQVLLNPITELKGIHMTTGVITTITIERTKDDSDFKLIVRKSAHATLPAAFLPIGATGEQPQHAQIETELMTQAKELVAYFFKRFHNLEASIPSSKAINQAISLITKYGCDAARHIIDFAYGSAQTTKFQVATFGAVMQYQTNALADFEKTKQRRQAAERMHEEQQRKVADEKLDQQYEAYRIEALARHRESLPADELAAIEQAAVAHFEQTDTNRYGRDRMRAIAIDKALETHGNILSLTEWKELQAGALRTNGVSYEA